MSADFTWIVFVANVFALLASVGAGYLSFAFERNSMVRTEDFTVIRAA